jgi:ABC-2 type transport system permease protein
MLRNMRSPLSYLLGLLMPVAIIFILPNVWREAPTMPMIWMILLMLLSANLMAALILEDRIDGSIMKVLISPTTMTSYIFQNLLASVIPYLFQFTLLGVVGLVLHGWTIGFTVNVLAILFVTAFAAATFAFCWNMFFRSKNSSNYAYLFFMALVMLFGGLMVPTQAMPPALQNVGAIAFPFWSVRALDELRDYGGTLQFWLYAGIVLLFGVAFLLIGGRRRKM